MNFAELRAAASARKTKLRSVQENPFQVSPVPVLAPLAVCPKEETRPEEHPVAPTIPATVEQAPSQPAPSDQGGLLNKYKKMLRVGVPMHSVLKKMGEEQFDVSLYDEEIEPAMVDLYYRPAFLAAEAAAKAPVGAEKPRVAQQNMQEQRKKIHFCVIPKSMATLKIVGDDGAPTLWSQCSGRTLSEQTRTALNSLFVKVNTNTKATTARANKLASASSSSSSNSLIDRARAQNIAIILVGLKLSTDEWRDRIYNLTFGEQMSENLKMMIATWPTDTEQKEIQAFDGDVQRLGRAEKFLVGLRDIPRLKKKLECLHFRLVFTTRTYELRQSMVLVERATNQIMVKEKFAAAMEYVFRLCCFLNYGDDDTTALATGKGFRMSALAQLLCAKSFDSSVSLLQIIVQSMERDCPEIANFADELTLLGPVSNTSIQTIRSELASLAAGYAMLIEETKMAPSAETDVPNQVDSDTTNFLATLANFAAEVDLELRALRQELHKVDTALRRFNEYLEENETTPFNELVAHIANFVTAYKMERAMFVATVAPRFEHAAAAPPMSQASNVSSVSHYQSAPSSFGNTESESGSGSE